MMTTTSPAFRRPAPRRPRALIAAFLLSALCWGCEEPKFTSQQANTFVTEWADQYGPKLKEQLSSGSVPRALEAELKAARESEGEPLKRVEPSYAAIVSSLYAEREHKPAFVTKGEVNESGERVIETLRQVEADGFAAAPYRLEELDQALERLKELKRELDAMPDVTVSPEAREQIAAVVLKRSPEEFELEPSSYGALTEALEASDEGEAISAEIARSNALGQELSQTQAKIEALLAIGLARYARSMRYARTREIFVYPREDDEYNDPETRRSRPDEAEGAYQAGWVWREAIFTVDAMQKARGEELLLGQLRQALKEALKPNGLEPMLAALSPGPQYEGLKREHVRYAQIAAEGGWPEVPEQSKLRKGQRAPVVKQLKERLAVEGYLSR